METCEVLITGQEWPSMPLLPQLRRQSGFSKSFTKVLLLKSRMHFSGNFFIPDITTSVVCNRSQSFASTHFTVNKYLNKRLKGPLLPHTPLNVLLQDIFISGKPSINVVTTSITVTYKRF